RLRVARPVRKSKRRSLLENHHTESQSHKGIPDMKKTLSLDKEELQILEDFERGEFKRIPNFQAEKKALEDSARNSLQKDKRINIRISSRDLERIQMRAAREGMPYQTYISSTLHKLVSGRLEERV